MSGVIKDEDRKLMETKSDAEIETIMDTYFHGSASPFRQAAVEEKHRRLKEQNARNESIQQDIRWMTKVILFLTVLSFVVGIIALVK